MRNQTLAAEWMGVRARTIHSENLEDWQEVERVYGVSGRIDPALQDQPGRALSIWGYAGYGSLALTRPDLRREPVLLVNDLVDSRWTLTVAAWLLRLHGSGEVWPFALAQAGGGP